MKMGWLVVLLVVFCASTLRAQQTHYVIQDVPQSPLALYDHKGFYGDLSEGGPINERFPQRISASFQKNPAQRAFLVDTIEQRIGLIENGRFYWIAGSPGTSGHRDGAGDRALFAMGGRGYPSAGAAVDSKGNLYLTDGYNNAIRKISRQQDGRWFVSTVASNVPVPIAITVDSNDNVWFEAFGLYRLSAQGKLTSFGNKNPKNLHVLGFNSMSADAVGNVYAMSRDAVASILWQITPEGQLIHLAGISALEWQQRKKAGTFIVDGPAKEASLHVPGIGAVEPDGSAIYMGGGDETQVRRYKDGRVSSLMKDGTWEEVQDRRAGLYVGSVSGMDVPKGIIYTSKYHWIHLDGNQWTHYRMLVPTRSGSLSGTVPRVTKESR